MHDLHLWTISSDRISLSAHVVVADLGQWGELLADLGAILERYGVTHYTLQPEPQLRNVYWRRPVAESKSECETIGGEGERKSV